MAKKKGKKKKKEEADEGGGGGDGEGEAAVKEPHPDAEEIKLRYIIEDLKFRLEDAKKVSDAKSEENAKLAKELKEDRKKHSDVEFFLNQKLDQNYNEIERLEKALVNLRSEKEIGEEQAASDLAKKKTEMETEVAKVELELEKKTQELQNLKQFIDMKEELGSKMNRMEAELAMVKSETHKQLVEEDKRRVREKEKLQEEMLHKIELTKQDAYAHSQSMLHSTTRKAMEENARMSSELQFQSKALEKLMKEKEELTKQNRGLRQEIEMHQQMQEEFAKKTQVYQLLLQKLNDKIRVNDDKQRDSAEKMMLRDKQLSNELVSTDNVLQKLSSKVERLETTLKRTQHNNERLRDELRRIKHASRSSGETRDEVVSMLLASAEDVRRQMVQRPGEVFNNSTDFAPARRSLLPNRRRDTPTSFSELSLVGREKLIENLLSRLGSLKIALLNQAFIESHESPRTRLPPLQAYGGGTGDVQFTYGDTGRDSQRSWEGGGAKRSAREWSRFGPGRSIGTNTTYDDREENVDRNGGVPVSPELVASRLRPWGKRSRDLPKNPRGAGNFLRKNEPGSAKPWMNQR